MRCFAGHCIPAVPADESCRIEQVLIEMPQASDAAELCRAVQLMSQRAHPDVFKLAQMFQDYMRIYEEQKAAQLDARDQLSWIECAAMVSTAPCLYLPVQHLLHSYTEHCSIYSPW